MQCQAIGLKTPDYSSINLASIAGNKLRAQRPRLAARRISLKLGHLLQQLPEQRRLAGRQVLREMVHDSLAVCLTVACPQKANYALAQVCCFINLRDHRWSMSVLCPQAVLSLESHTVSTGMKAEKLQENATMRPLV